MKYPRPDYFVTKMTAHWENDLGNESSDKLKAAWRQMATSFTRQILKNRGVLAEDAIEQKPWTVLPIPTGAGKTQGLCLYCALLSKIYDSEKRTKHPGVLIVTRLIEDADKIRDTINDLTGKCVAVSYHSKTDRKFLPLKHTRLFPVLVICHQAFGNALEAVASDEALFSNWLDYTHWSYGERKLKVIDESLDVVKAYHINHRDFDKVCGAIPAEIRRQHRAEEKAIRALGERFRQRIEKKGLPNEGRLIRTTEWLHEETDFSALIKTLKRKKILTKTKSSDEKGKLLQTKIRNVVCGMEAMKYGWAVHSAYRGTHTLSTARLILPDFVQRAAVLDATAKINPVYDYLEEENVGIPALPKGIRSYRNVTLHVCFNHPAGKEAISKQDYPHFDLLMNYLSERIERDKQVFFCVHKDTEERLKGRYSKLFPEHDFGHWGAIDGRNDWKDYDTMVIYGLPFVKPVDPLISILSFQDWQSRRSGKIFKPVITKALREDAARYADQFMVVRLIQAINRIRCRKVIDDKGNCAKSDVYLFLHGKKKGEQFIEAIKDQMPGIRIKNLEDVPTEKLKKDRSLYAAMVIEYLAKQPPGRYPVLEIKKRFGMSMRTMRRLIEKADMPKNSFAQELKAINVRYEPDMGAGAESCFVKD